ncbi:MAG: hypothetical protein R3Y24_16785 [Eubacteriales bacterium]
MVYVLSFIVLQNLVVSDRKIETSEAMKEDIRKYLEAMDSQDKGLKTLQDDVQVVDDLERMYLA